MMLGRILAQSGNLPYYDDRFFHFGFSLGINMMDYSLTPSKDSTTYKAADSSHIPGFSVGIITDMRLNRYLNLRFIPTLNIGEGLFHYSSSGGFDKTLNVTSIPVTLPIYLKYSAERKYNYRPYLIWGGGCYVDLGRKTTEDLVLLKPFNYFTEFGVGCDIYFSFFKLSPELKFAIGFNNMLTPASQRDSGIITSENEFYTTALSGITSRMLTLTFNFE